jgi:hypothetical protein
VAELLQQIGRLQKELEWLKKTALHSLRVTPAETMKSGA